MFAIHKREILLPSSVDMVRMFNFTDKVKEGYVSASLPPSLVVF